MALVGRGPTALVAQAADTVGARGVGVRPEAGAGFGTYHAIIFAASNYAPNSGLPSLHFPRVEAESLRAVLVRRYAFAAQRVAVVHDPTRAGILDSLYALSRRLGPDDNLLVVYSGHGHYDSVATQGYWQPADARAESPSGWVTNQDIKDMLARMRARQVLVVSDACFSGALARSGGPGASDAETVERALQVARRSSRKALMAGPSGSVVPASSVFARELIAALQREERPVVTATDLHAMIRAPVLGATRIEPQFGHIPGVGSEQGDFVFVRRDVSIQAAAGGIAATRPRGIDPAAGRALRDGIALAAARRPDEAAKQFTAACDGGVAEACAKLGDALRGGWGVERNPERAVAAYQRACDAGSSLGCVELGSQYDRGVGTARDVRRALELWTRACDADEPLGCSRLGVLHLQGGVVPKDERRARELFERACGAGSASAGHGCRRLGAMLVDGAVGRSDTARAVSFLDRACRLEKRWCDVLAQAQVNGIGVPRDSARARSNFAAACDSANAWACVRLGHLAVAQAQGAADSARARTLWGRACDDGESDGCLALAGVLYEGAGVPRDVPRAQRLLELGCGRDDAAACSELGFLYQADDNPARDPSRAALFSQRACDLGNEFGCFNLGVWYQYGRGVLIDLSRAASLYLQACNRRVAKGCLNLGVQYLSGRGIPEDKRRAAELFKEACTLGEGLGCSNIAEMYQHAWRDPLELRVWEPGAYEQFGSNYPRERALHYFRLACDAGHAESCARAPRPSAAPSTSPADPPPRRPRIPA